MYWDPSPDADVVGYEIREGYAWDESSLITTGVTDTNYRVAITTERAYKFFVKAKNSSGYYSQNPARVSIVVTELTPKNVIFTYDEIALANGTFNSTEIGASHWTWQNYGGKFSDYPDTKFSEIGGSNVLKLLVGADGKYPSKGWYYPKSIDIGSIITCYVSCLFTSTATKKEVVPHYMSEHPKMAKSGRTGKYSSRYNERSDMLDLELILKRKIPVDPQKLINLLYLLMYLTLI